MYFVRTPTFVQRIWSNFTWRDGEETLDPVIYLTFDDGPIPEVTPWVLRELAKFDAKATFFCVGENAERNADILQEIIAQGHSIGNHTHNHLNGWTTNHLPYIRNVRRCSKVIDSALFRPPYGRLSPRKAQYLQRHYRIVMWDVLSGDFDQDLSPEACLSNVLNNVRPGSIVVFHDSLKSEKNLRYTLPKVLKVLSSRGYKFKAISQGNRLDKSVANIETSTINS